MPLKKQLTETERERIVAAYNYGVKQAEISGNLFSQFSIS